ncbi:MAG TPA: tetratricopeptide repeat protein [Agriterribacter sp.]|nr:tetratricopeptide repeat protein [Agriterribacter sp.]
MKKWLLLYVCYILSAALNGVFGQSNAVDILNHLLKQNTAQDTNRVKLLNKLSEEWRGIDIATSRSKAEEAYHLSLQQKYISGEAYALRNIGISYMMQGDFLKANEFLQKGLISAKQNSDSKATALILLGLGFVHSNMGEYPKAINYLEQALTIVHQNNDSVNLSAVLANLGQVYYFQGNYPKALDYTLQSLKNAEQINDKQATAKALTGVGNIYSEVGDQEQALSYLKKALTANEELGSKRDISIVLNGIGNVYRLRGKYADAIDNYQRAIKLKQELKSEYGVALNESRLADIYLSQRNAPLALEYAYKALPVINAAGDKDNVGFIYDVIARSWFIENKIDSAIYHGRQSLVISKETGNNQGIADASKVLADAYAQKNDFANAYKYQQQFTAYRDSVSSDSVTRRVGLLLYNYDLEKKQGEITSLIKDKNFQAEVNKKQRELLIVSFAGLGILGVMAIALWRNNRQKQQANLLLTKQKEEINLQSDQLMLQNKEISHQKDHLERAIEELTSTQALLIQKEKMASLGELTAGIAHEIQNPLNFVNNFSEVNKELLIEMKDEMLKGNYDNAREIADDAINNEGKINHHGKRAGDIVKAMLQHSRGSSGVREPTDINVLCDEYARLAYHGLRAKDKSFNATINTDFDSTLAKINIAAQDIGRVVLNLINNAFYAVTEKKKQQQDGYDPTVTVTTKQVGDKVAVSVKDNGNGIPDSIKEKIFQPFFTTKPTGQGTGLGLSLSYDIVKAHGGEIKVESKDGEGTEFVVQLPIV